MLSPSGAPLLAVEGLQAWYGESHVLHGATFDVFTGVFASFASSAANAAAHATPNSARYRIDCFILLPCERTFVFFQIGYLPRRINSLQLEPESSYKNRCFCFGHLQKENSLVCKIDKILIA